MIAVDTNVLARFLVEDDPDQLQRAKAFFQKAIQAKDACSVSDVVLCELVWVLERTYKFKRSEIHDVLRRLLRAQHLTFSFSDRISHVLEAYQSGRGGFADYMIREYARELGCEAVATFDGELLKETGFLAI